MGAIRAAARQTVVASHDLKTHCLPAWTRFVLGDDHPTARATA